MARVDGVLVTDPWYALAASEILESGLSGASGSSCTAHAASPSKMMLKLSLLVASAAAFQPRAPVKAPTVARQFGMLDGLFKKSEADVTEKVYFDISIGGGAPQRVELGLYGDTRCTNQTSRRLLDGEARDPTG